MELKKYTDVVCGVDGAPTHLVGNSEEGSVGAGETVGYPFFGQIILDSLGRTSDAMPQEHTFKAAELALVARGQAG